MHDGEAGDPQRQGGPKRLIVEGWRFLAHSYAMVNQWQLLALSRRPDIAVKVRDVPFYRRRWQSQTGIFNPGDEQALKSLDIARTDEPADVTLRVALPLDFSPARRGRTAVFGTSETQILRSEQFGDQQAYQGFLRTPPPAEITVITPSLWSAEGFCRAGFKNEQVVVIPHGVDTGTFHPMPEIRAQVRKSFSYSEDNFVFLSVGAMSGNKGIDLLLQAFSEVCRNYPHARLVLKGMDSLYQSRDFLSQCMQTVPAPDRQRVEDRVTYLGDSFSNDKMAKLYQVADAYVSPYRAEGFNIPVLEAAACGIPIVCTRGGATDDFVTDEFARRIDSRKSPVLLEGQEGFRLEPDVGHLTALMASAIEDRSWRERAAKAGPQHVCANYTWDLVVGMLVRQLLS